MPASERHGGIGPTRDPHPSPVTVPILCSIPACMVAAVCSCHERHGAALADIQARRSIAVSASTWLRHAQIGTYAALTDPQHRIAWRTADSWTLVETNFARCGRASAAADVGFSADCQRQRPEGRHEATIAECSAQGRWIHGRRFTPRISIRRRAASRWSCRPTGQAEARFLPPAAPRGGTAGSSPRWPRCRPRCSLCREQARDLRQVGDGLEVRGRLFASERAVEIAADADVPRAAGDVADVVDVIDERLERHAGSLRRRHAALPARIEHPRVQRDADHRAARGQRANLVVAELAVVRHQRAAVVVAGPDAPAEGVERFPEAVVAQVGGVQDEPEAVHLLQQRPADARRSLQ